MAIELVRILGADEYRIISVGPDEKFAIGAPFALYDKTLPPGYKSKDVLNRQIDLFRRMVGSKMVLSNSLRIVMRNLEHNL